MNCVCKECGKVFTVACQSKARTFCSKTCSMRFRWRHSEKNVQSFICETCGKSFEIPKSDHRLKEGSKIRFCSKKCMGIGMRTGSIQKCANCGSDFYTTRNIFCCQNCAREYRKKNYKHKTYIENGYVVEYKAGYNKKSSIKQHRRIMEEFLGRRLEPNEVVHHKNGNKTDNRIENLEVIDRGKHSAYHRKKEKAEGKQLFGGYHNN